jgi:hypothetical protein
LTVAQAKGTTILEAVAMEVVTMEIETTKPAGEAMTSTAPGSSTTVAPEASAEERAEPHPQESTQVVVREVMIEDVAPLRSVPMPETGSSSCGGLELLDDDLIDSAFVSLSMESCHRMEN